MARVLSIVLLSVLLTGCSVNKDETQNENADNPYIHVKQSNIEEKKKMSADKVAEHLVEIASSIPNVNDATAVVAGQYAVVGIDVNSKLDRSRVGSIKYSVAESLKKDPYGANAVVIADPDTYERLKKMGVEIKQGRPIGGVLEELAGIIGRLMPQIPADIKEPVEPTEQNDQELPEGKEQKLDKEQEDQSNNRLNKPS
jgi:YhcN/YlaJ family sporulation lipoprotein